MKIYVPILIFILSIIVCSGFSQEIKLPDERIFGEDIRIEKTQIFFFSFPPFKVVLPEISSPPEQYIAENIPSDIAIPELKPYAGYMSFALGSYATFQNIVSYRLLREKTVSYFELESFLSDGHRDNNERQKTHFNFQMNSPHSKLSLGLTQGAIGLPGPEDNPFDRGRDFFSFNTGYSFIKNPEFVPSISQRFYRIDNSTETNFTLLNLAMDRHPFIFETGIERQDVFNADFSSTGLYQSIHMKQERLKIGGALKVIERHGVRFLPSLAYNIHPNWTLNISGTYRIPDLYKDIISDEYKELVHYKIAPEEEYKASLVFHKKWTDTYLSIDISPSYRDNFYGWADIDNNGLFEPLPQQYWQTSVNLKLQHKLTDYFRWYMRGEKNFLSEDIDYHPAKAFNTGFVLNYKNVLFNTWISYTGERQFAEKKLGGASVINAEVIVNKKNQMEFGISVYNITDKDTFKVPGYPAKGRNILSFIRFFF